MKMKRWLEVDHSGMVVVGQCLTRLPGGPWRLDGTPVYPMALMSVRASGGAVICGDRISIKTVEQIPSDKEGVLFEDGNTMGEIEAQSVNIDGVEIYFQGFGLTTGYKVIITPIVPKEAL